jgi:Protein of unknown function (DUF4031)
VTVYVDDMRRRARVGKLNAVWSHLLIGPEDEIGELHEFARKLGLRREWFQGPPKHPWPRSHYDVTDSKRLKAIELGAIPITYIGDLPRMFGVARERRYARAVELAEAHGHDIDCGENRWHCRRCFRVAVRPGLVYGLATSEPCPPPPPWLEPPPDAGDGPAAVSLGHMAVASRLHGLVLPVGDGEEPGLVDGQGAGLR